jgi:hypothetical protein
LRSTSLNERRSGFKCAARSARVRRRAGFDLFLDLGRAKISGTR